MDVCLFWAWSFGASFTIPECQVPVRAHLPSLQFRPGPISAQSPVPPLAEPSNLLSGFQSRLKCYASWQLVSDILLRQELKFFSWLVSDDQAKILVTPRVFFSQFFCSFGTIKFFWLSQRWLSQKFLLFQSCRKIAKKKKLEGRPKFLAWSSLTNQEKNFKSCRNRMPDTSCHEVFGLSKSEAKSQRSKLEAQVKGSSRRCKSEMQVGGASRRCKSEE